MTQTLVRPSTLKARKIPPTGRLIGRNAMHLRRRHASTVPTQEGVKDLEWAMMCAQPFAPVPFKRNLISEYLTDDQRIELYRRRAIGQTRRYVAETCGVSHGSVDAAEKSIPLQYEAVYG